MFNVNKDNSGLLQREYDVLLMLSAHRNSDTGKCFPSEDTLANECHISKRTINEAISGLELKGWLTYKRGGKRGSVSVPNDYTLNVDKIMTFCAVVQKIVPIQTYSDNTFRKQWYGIWYNNEIEYNNAKEATKNASKFDDDENAPF